MSYHDTITAYRNLLADHPGEALEIGDGCFAVLVDGHLYGVQQDLNGDVTTDGGFDFDVSAYDEECDCWDGDVSGMQTSNAIANPRYVRITILKAQGLTYPAVFNAYDKLLTANPGKALMLTDNSVLFLDGLELCEAPLKDGVVDYKSAAVIDPRAWSESECCWQCDDDSEMTVAVINNPRWVELDFIESAEHLKRDPAKITHEQ